MKKEHRWEQARTGCIHSLSAWARHKHSTAELPRMQSSSLAALRSYLLQLHENPLKVGLASLLGILQKLQQLSCSLFIGWCPGKSQVVLQMEAACGSVQTHKPIQMGPRPNQHAAGAADGTLSDISSWPGFPLHLLQSQKGHWLCPLQE